VKRQSLPSARPLKIAEIPLFWRAGPAIVPLKPVSAGDQYAGTRRSPPERACSRGSGSEGLLRTVRCSFIKDVRVRFGIMATQDLSQELGPIARISRRGSVVLVLLVAAGLIAAVTGLTLVGQGRAEAYVMVLLAVLATIGVFALLAGATGILRVGDDSGHA